MNGLSERLARVQTQADATLERVTRLEASNVALRWLLGILIVEQAAAIAAILLTR